MIMQGGIIGLLLHEIAEDLSRRAVHVLLDVNPSQSVRKIGLGRRFLNRPLRETLGLVQIAAILRKIEGHVIQRHRIVGLTLQNPLQVGSGVPIPAQLIQSCRQHHVDPAILRS